MKREEIKTILGESATDEVVTKLLDALHAEIEPHKTAAKTGIAKQLEKANGLLIAAFFCTRLYKAERGQMTPPVSHKTTRYERAVTIP